MKQIIIGGGEANQPNTTAARFSPLQGSDFWTTADIYLGQLVSIAGTLKQLRVRLSTAPGAGKSYNIRLMKNAVAQALQVTISDTDTIGVDESNEVSVSPGDYLYLRCTPSGTPAATYVQWSINFECTTAGASLVMGSPGHGTASYDTNYAPLMSGTSVLDDTESSKREIIPTAGKLKNLYVRSHAALTASQTLIFTVRVNGVDTALTCTIPNSGQTANNTADEVTVAAGDIVTLKMVGTPLGAGRPGVVPTWGVEFLADRDGESIVMNCPRGNMSNIGTLYNKGCAGQEITWGGTESNFYQLANAFVAGKFYVQLTGAPGAGDGYTLTIRKNGADTAIVVVIADTATTGNDHTHSAPISDGDVLDIEATPVGSPTAVGAFYGFVVEFTPPAGGKGSIKQQMVKKLLV